MQGSQDENNSLHDDKLQVGKPHTFEKF